MAKGDVEMEGTEKKSQDVENTEVVDGQQSSDSLMEHQDSAKAETEDQRAKSPTPAENGNEEQETANNMVESESNVNDQAVDQTDSTSVVEGSSDAKNAASETENPSDTIGQSDTQGNKVGDDQNRSGIESLDQNSAMGGIEGEIEIKKKEGDLDADVAVKNEEPIENSADHDTRGGNVLLHEEVPADEVGESFKEVKEFHQNGNDTNVDERKEGQDKTNTETVITDSDAMLVELPETKDDVNNIGSAKMPEPATPNLLMKSATIKAGQHTDEEKMAYDEDDYEDGDDEGTPEAQAAFMRELESFYRGRAMEFKPPKFYGNQLNCLKLWRSVIRLGGYDRVTGSKLWRQVGESFNPPKTCTTVSWTFRIFYEKALLEYERHRIQSGELQLPIVALPEAGADHEGNGYQATGSGRARRDAAARAMQGWHEQRLLGYGEVGEPIIKDKNANSMLKREKNLKSISSLKHKRPNEVEQPAKVARTETFKQLVTTVVDLGPPADWVKINVRETEDCFEVYALVPGLLREEVRVQSDPAGRLVITGQPEQLDNPWGITAFKKVVSLPGRIDPLQTSATVSLHGRLSVRVPFAQ